MALQGTITVTTSGNAVSFGTTAATSDDNNLNFRATFLQLDNLGVGNIWLDITTTSGCSTGYQLNTVTARTLSGLAGIKGFSAIASTAGGSVSLAYLAAR
jgi:hypothetical protein